MTLVPAGLEAGYSRGGEDVQVVGPRVLLVQVGQVEAVLVEAVVVVVLAKVWWWWWWRWW